ncbi:Putative transglycosylase SLT domain 1, Lysozyme-like domain superfamily [Septoria linicola]|uniref:Transglycosylase SLT domain 1, Lysozyme-like domain superfamily n=1 Tax=Septoria linicola TaxID=215465 RepID=A0A9Q9EIH6_9PEZI|nr:Putative transglycosylase SLT domain 1, Lysozyme-like domain superfamily [Septoria linicola]
MPRYEPRDDTDDSLSSSYEARLPRRPRPAALTAASSYESKHSSLPTNPSLKNYHQDERVREDAGRSRYAPRALSSARRPHERREPRPALESGREERRKRRSARDPERERRRQERAARDPEYEARRQERHASRRAERRASRAVQPEEGRYASPVEQSPQRAAVRFQEDRSLPPAVPASPDSPANSLPADSVTNQGYAQDRNLDYEDSYAGPRQQDYHSPLDEHYRQAPTRAPPREYQQAPRSEWDADLENSSFDEKKRPHSRSTSTFSELEWYKRGTISNGRHHYRKEERRGCCGFSRLCSCITAIVVTLIVLIIIIAVAVTVSKKKKFSYTPSTLQVNETAAFASGAATRNSVGDTKDGIGAGRDVYTLYTGNATKMLAEVPSSKWVSFEDMWNNNLDTLQNACGWLKYGENDTPEEIVNIYNAIQDRANASLVDHRLILAFILQESKGCLHTPATESSGGVKNTGLMQAHNGHEYSPKNSEKSILEMVQDGTQGTKKGNGLVQELNAYYGNPYAAARAYNSGYIPQSGELTEAAGATKCYVSDIANRLTGWVKAESSCSDSGH